MFSSLPRLQSDFFQYVELISFQLFLNLVCSALCPSDYWDGRLEALPALFPHPCGFTSFCIFLRQWDVTLDGACYWAWSPAQPGEVEQLGLAAVCRSCRARGAGCSPLPGVFAVTVFAALENSMTSSYGRAEESAPQHGFKAL